MTDFPSSSPGILSAARELLEGLVGTVHDRLELVAIEVQEEKFRLIRTFLWLGAAFFTGMLALLFLSLTIVYCCRGEGRLIALVAITATYLAALLALVLGARRHFAREPRPFEDTVREMARDRACIPPES